jgi:serine-type D-Ala-D-Ala carboxypeptidase (penicillin-binding protein 5/6)
MVAPFRLDSLTPEQAPGAVPPRRNRHTRRNRRRRWGRRPLLAVLALVVVLVAAVVVVVRVAAPQPVAAVVATVRPTAKVSSAPVTLPWPASGQAAIAIPSLGVSEASGLEKSVPVASLTKMMTAYLILRDHPLRLGESGPQLTMTQTDVGYFDVDTVEDEANVQVTVGEVLSEEQLLDGLLVHSANNLALTLARWDAGSVSAFVAKMNRAARALGMDHTHYADPSGYSQDSQSTASDSLKVAAADMANPVFASIVKMPSVTLPVAGTISTYTPLLGYHGVEGIKSGFTTVAGGCDVLAVVRQVHGRNVLILTAVTGQQGFDVLFLAGLVALNLAVHVASSIGITPVVAAGDTVARVTAAGHTVDAVAQSTANMLTWPGARISQVFEQTRPVPAGTAAGTRFGDVAVALGTQRATVPVWLQQRLPRATALQRIF